MDILIGVAILYLLYGRRGTDTGDFSGKLGKFKFKKKKSTLGKPGSLQPPGNPPGGCVQHYNEAEVEAVLIGLGYNPQPGVFGPDGKLGTYDAKPDAEIQRFQNEYNSASRRGVLGAAAGGLDPDGLMGKCTMAGLRWAYLEVGPAEWPGQTKGMG